MQRLLVFLVLFIIALGLCTGCKTANSSVQVDSGADLDSDADADVDSDSDTDNDADTDSDSDSDSDTDTHQDGGSDGDADTDTDTDSDTDSDTDKDAGADAGKDAGTDAGVDNSCPTYLPPKIKGGVASPQVTETSGVVVSRHDPEVLWVHNDSGGQAQIFAMRLGGKNLGTYQLSNVVSADWEDIAADDTHLYVGDIGDNAADRNEVVVYRIVEPTVAADQAPVSVSVDDVDVLTLNYPGGPRDAESLMADPVTGDLYIVSKEDGNNKVFRAPAPQPWNGATVTLELVVDKLPFKQVNPLELYAGETTGADISANGDAIVIRGYWRGYLWRRGPGQTIEEAFAGEACKIKVPTPTADGQGEAIGFALDSLSYYTVPEKTIGFPQARIRFYEEN